jgi:hypothetical protein
VIVGPSADPVPRGNSLFANSNEGINLDDGITSNDARDPDTGHTGLQNYLCLTGATIAGGETTITGTLDSTPRSAFVVQLFKHPFNSDGPSVRQRFFGQKSVETDRQGKARFSFTTTVTVAPDDWVTATATNRATGNSSEFSALVRVVEIGTGLRVRDGGRTGGGLWWRLRAAPVPA